MNKKRIRMAAGGVIALATLTAPAPALTIIDNFSAPVMGVEDPAGGTYATSILENPDAIDCIGGFRKITAEKLTGTDGSIIFAVNSGIYQDKAAMYMNDCTGRAVIEYGSFTDGAGDLDADFSAHAFFGITFVKLNETIDLVITVNNTADGEVSFSTEVLGSGDNYERFSVQFSDFAGFDFSDVDGIRYEFTALIDSTSMSIEFLDVSSIPEPVTLGLLALGLLALGGRHRRPRADGPAMNQ